MAKKKREQSISQYNILGLNICGVQRDRFQKDILCISGISIIIKLTLVFLTTAVFHSFIDLFDISIYLNYAASIANGQLPYLDFSIEYPILFLIPVIVPLPFALLTQDPWTYIHVYQIFMVFIDILIAIIVYLIALEIAGRDKAFLAGALYASAFSAAYFVITKYDAFPTLFMMLGLMLTIYGLQKGGYISIILGFFAKIFPAIALPYVLMYNAERTSVRDSTKKLLICAIPITLLLFVIPLILSPGSISAYLSATGGGLSVYVNTPTYTIHALLSIIGLDIAPDVISYGMYALMILTILYLLSIAYLKKIENSKNLLLFTFLTIFATIFLSKFYSPQYIVWLTPFFALFLAAHFKEAIMFYIIQIVAYIEFPILWGVLYENTQYVSEFGTSGWYGAAGFFMMKFIIVLFIIYHIIILNESFRKKVIPGILFKSK